MRTHLLLEVHHLLPGLLGTALDVLAQRGEAAFVALQAAPEASQRLRHLRTACIERKNGTRGRSSDKGTNLLRARTTKHPTPQQPVYIASVLPVRTKTWKHESTAFVPTQCREETEGGALVVCTAHARPASRGARGSSSSQTPGEERKMSLEHNQPKTIEIQEESAFQPRLPRPTPAPNPHLEPCLQP